MWIPPVGVPIPTFGVDETTPTAYTHFVSEQYGTDVNNPFGTALRPRKTIPLTIPAGAVVVLYGTYTHSHTSPNTLLSQGTAAKPAWIIGAGGGEFKAGVEITGTYLTVAAVKAVSIVIRDPASFISVRDNDISVGGMGVAKWGTGNVSDIVILRNNIHDVGDLSVTTDVDMHGITVNWGQRIWICDNTITRCSGDGVQVNAQTQANNPNVRYIYLGRNKSSFNRQSGLWCKWASDVLFSENECWGHQPGVGTIGPQLGVQYGPDRVYVYGNKLHDGALGFYAASYTPGSVGGLYVANNEIWNIRGAGSVSDPWSSGAAALFAGGNSVVFNGNNVHDCDGGIQMPAGNAYLQFNQNSILNIARKSVHIEGTPSWNYSGNHFDHPTTWVIQGIIHSYGPDITEKV